MKKKLLSLLVAATMIGSMAGTTTVFAGEDLEDVLEFSGYRSHCLRFSFRQDLRIQYRIHFLIVLYLL